MASKSDQDWQLSKKTVLERNYHMLNNPLMSDIKFTCGESKGKYFYAHKYVLATSSPVFYAMFYGDLAEKNSVIHLEDADEESFEVFLRFLYTDECTIKPEIAVRVMYLAKKYIILTLTEKCVKVLQDSMKPENVITVLEQTIHFDEKELEKKCWEMIDNKASEAVTSDAFNDINQKTLINLLKRESLKIEEVQLFQAVLKWSESECSKKGMEVTGKNKRAVLGDAIYQIRFLSMSEKEFVQFVSLTDLLPGEEILPIIHKFNGFDDPNLKWKLQKRHMETSQKIRCRRFDNCTSVWGYSGESDCLSFSVNKPATFYGVCLFGDSNCSKYDVTLEVKNAKVSGTYTSECKSRSPLIYGYDVMLPTPISVDINEVVTMVATIKGPPSYYGLNVKASVEVGGATVTFTNSQQLGNGTTVERGQFLEIILSI